jgi:hypothetical protein
MDEQDNAPPAWQPQRIATPPTSGTWLRLESGLLQPADEPTAKTAGIAWPPPESQVQVLESLGLLDDNTQPE